MKEEEYTPTLEEWQRATQYARFRYRWGLWITLACLMCLVILIGFVIYYATELSNHPAHYMMKSLGASYCTCYTDNNIEWYVDEEEISWKDTTPHEKIKYEVVNLTPYVG